MKLHNLLCDEQKQLQHQYSPSMASFLQEPNASALFSKHERTRMENEPFIAKLKVLSLYLTGLLKLNLTVHISSKQASQ